MEIKRLLKSKLFPLLVISLFGCQKNNSTLKEIKEDVIYLSDDKLEGRETGTIGEDLALTYIKNRFHQIGVATKIDTFDFNDKVEVIFNCELPNIYPTKYSSNDEVSNLQVVDVNFGIDAPKLNYSDYRDISIENKAVLINTSSPDGIHPHSKYLEYHNITHRIETAKKHGARCVIFYNNDKNAPILAKKFKKLKRTGLPILFLEGNKKKLLNTEVSFKLSLEERKLKGKNLIAYIDNNQQKTIIMGAHYDHIGWGKEGSRYTGEPQIHNGADDNASGVAALIQLAKFYQQSSYDAYNYIFIAFSGEEKGLLGSNAYVKKRDKDIHGFNCMINLDMIGRLDTANTLQIYGTGTSPSWDDLIDTNNTYGFKIKKSKSGTGPSDHTTFYLQDIPVLHFFTGVHDDYHKPTDDAEKINYQGIVDIVLFIEDIINDLAEARSLVFAKTKEENNRSVPRFSVTLGVIPDYLYEEGGMRIDGVSSGRPAQQAGMKKGDVIIRLGTYKIEDIYAYMKALGAYKKGDTTNVNILRDEQEVQLRVVF